MKLIFEIIYDKLICFIIFIHYHYNNDDNDCNHHYNDDNIHNVNETVI